MHAARSPFFGIAARPAVNRENERLYTPLEVARLTGAGIDQLRRWDRNGMLPASHRNGGRRRYDFRDLIAVRTAVGLLGSGVSAIQVRKAISALRELRPDLEDPLASLRVFTDSGRLVVNMDGALLEPVSGQLLLALPVGDLAKTAKKMTGEVIEVKPKKTRVDRDGAERWFERALEADSRDGGNDEAEHAYRRALEQDSNHPGALLNLGNLLYARGDLEQAREFYRRAIESAPQYAEAHYNLANVLDDLDDRNEAISAYKHTLELAPDFQAAHFNLALVLEKVGKRHQARHHWRCYLEYDRESPSAEVARSFLAEEDD